MTSPSDHQDSAIHETEYCLPAAAAGKRFDVALASILTHCSRSYVTKLLKDGAILVNDSQVKPSRKAAGGEHVAIEWPAPEVIEAKPEAIPLDVLHEDADVIVVNKPFGMPVHPSPGHASGTLVNALLAHCQDLSTINGTLRPGIVHRLDMNTTGVIVSAKNDHAHRHLQDQFADRTVRKTYLALCRGNPKTDSFVCEGRIGRHPTRRTEMTVMRRHDEGREARTAFEVLERYRSVPSDWLGGRGDEVSFVEARPRTGRTHQIRVHLAKSGYPLLADDLYGKEEALQELGLSRHALHAACLEFEHPVEGNRVAFEASLASDMAEAMQKLRSL